MRNDNDFLAELSSLMIHRVSFKSRIFYVSLHVQYITTSWVTMVTHFPYIVSFTVVRLFTIANLDEGLAPDSNASLLNPTTLKKRNEA